ncbi:MAG: hypothetical protein Q7S61_04445 [bacterium]|nr:hypothetical protein [bacterium]
MVEKKVKTALGILILFYLFMSSALFTDADLSAESRVRGNTINASTLSISLRNSVNNSPASSFFHSTGFQPQGFDVGAIRLKNDGIIQSYYYLKTELPTPSPLCTTLDLKITDRNMQTIYEGKLASLNQRSDLILGTAPKDLIFFLMLNSATNDLKNQICSFRIAVQTKDTITPSKQGFYSRKYLDSVITSGTW